MDCCELALYNGKLALYIALSAFATLIICLAIFRNYYIKMKGLTVELKKKNGKEQKQIDELKKEVEQLKQGR